MKIAALLAVAVCASNAAAQSVPSSAVPPKSCGDPGRALEIAFELSAPKAAAPIRLVYADCSDMDRDDLEPGYTERVYRGADGWGLTLVTNHGDGAYKHDTDTTVLISKGKEWVGRLGAHTTAELISGPALRGDGFELKKTGPPSIPACEAALPKPHYRGPELWLVTKTKAYYYYEDCDICAELDSCDLRSHKLQQEIVAHSVSCSELQKFKAGGDVVYEGCSR